MNSSDKRILNREWFCYALLALLVILFCSKLLFTDQIIRASDVITQFFWSAKNDKSLSLLGFFHNLPGIFHADWDMRSDGGRTLEGGWNAITLLFHRYLILHLFPFPAGIAWLAAFAMCWGSIGTFKYCRLIGLGRLGAFAAGLIYVLCSENLTLLNAGHIQKLEAICWFPWVLLFLEKAFRSGRLFHYALAALMLALQFFHMHWQISFYSCLAVGIYASFHAGARFLTEGEGYAAPFRKDLVLTVIMVLLFFSTIAMSFVPLVSWSKQSERGDAVASSGPAAAGGGSQQGIGYDEGMSWSLPPEEILTFAVPGLFGFSRQEGGDVANTEDAYYWGRMRFTQTSDYLGLLPWFLLPLPLMFRRNRYTWFCTFLMGLTLVMALGKYTFVYRLMFEYLPAFSKFRVPKMILFLFAFGASVLAGSGLDLLAASELPRKKIALWLAGCASLVLSIAGLWLLIPAAGDTIFPFLREIIGEPTRYQSGDGLVSQRYVFMLRECVVAFAMGLLYLGLLFVWFRKWLPGKALLPLLLIVLLGDLWRVDHRFLVTTTPPESGVAKKNDIVEFLQPRMEYYRMQPMNQENAHYYADNGFANISAYVTISERRYKEFLDNFNMASSMADMMNLKYLIMNQKDFQSQRGQLGEKYVPVLTSNNGSVVLQNQTVLPKAWLVPSAAVVADPRQRLGIISTDLRFNPARVALVETPPPLPLAPYGASTPTGAVTVKNYVADRIELTAASPGNAVLVLGEKYYKGWRATVDGKAVEIYPVDHILRGIYLPAGSHNVEFFFDPLPFKVGKYVTLASFTFFALLFVREFLLRGVRQEQTASALSQVEIVSNKTHHTRGTRC
jgi:hypothetical protein